MSATILLDEHPGNDNDGDRPWIEIRLHKKIYSSFIQVDGGFHGSILLYLLISEFVIGTIQGNVSWDRIGYALLFMLPYFIAHFSSKCGFEKNSFFLVKTSIIFRIILILLLIIVWNYGSATDIVIAAFLQFLNMIGIIILSVYYNQKTEDIKRLKRLERCM